MGNRSPGFRKTGCGGKGFRQTLPGAEGLLLRRVLIPLTYYLLGLAAVCLLPLFA